MINIAIKLLTSVTYTATGEQTTFAIPFDYLRPAFIYVDVDEQNITEGFEVVDRTVKFATPPAKDAVVRIYRNTATKRLVSWADASILKAIDMTIAEVQQLHLIEEEKDWSRENTVHIDKDDMSSNQKFNPSFRVKPDAFIKTNSKGTGLELYDKTDMDADIYRETHKYLTEHPEYVTTVKDNSLTEPKFMDGAVSERVLQDGAVSESKLSPILAKKKASWYKSVAEMKADVLLSTGMAACTLGYYSPNDGGGATYIIRAKQEADVDDGGSLHELANGLVAELVVENGTVNVKQFGAKGDGVSDDTERVKIAIKYHVDKRYKLMFVGTFFVTDSLMNKEDYTDEVYINFEGIKPLQETTYSGRNNSVILFKNGISLFQGITLKGSIYRTTFVPQSRSTTGCIFKNCKLASFCFMYNSVSNILAFCLDTSLSSTSKIAYNKFLTVYYFAKNETSDAACTDSTICHNYINGGAELNDNACFQWCFFNGSTVSHNFIDYYRAIYEPKSNQAFYFQGPMSSMNQYQVFRYLYLQGEASSITFHSCGDIINWTDISKLEKLRQFVPIMYKDKNDIEHEMPPYTIQVNGMNNIVFNSLYIQNNVSDLIFIQSGLSGYKNAGCTVRGLTIVSYISKGLYDKYVNQVDEIFIGGTYKNNMVDIPFIKTLDELPTVSAIWGAYYPGEKVRVGDNCYRLVYSDVDNTGTAKYHWVPIYTGDYE